MRFNLISWPVALGATGLLVACAGTGAADANDPSTPPGSTQATEVRSDAPPRNQCDAAAAQSLVGQAYEPAALERARATAGADEARMLHENSIITKEYKMGRLNVVVDETGRIVRVYCG